MAKFTDKFFNRVIEGKFVAESGDDFSEVLKNVEQFDGEVKITDTTIASADRPSKSGLYILVNNSNIKVGVLAYNIYATNNVHVSGFVKDVAFSGSFSGTGNISLSNFEIKRATPLYKHTVRLLSEDYDFTLEIFANKIQQYTALTLGENAISFGKCSENAQYDYFADITIMSVRVVSGSNLIEIAFIADDRTGTGLCFKRAEINQEDVETFTDSVSNLLG